jgi:hypothetical protein
LVHWQLLELRLRVSLPRLGYSFQWVAASDQELLDGTLFGLPFCYFQQAVVFSIPEANNLTIQGCAFKENHDDIDADAVVSVTLDGCSFSGGSFAGDGVTVVSTVDAGHALATVTFDVEGGMVRCAFPLMPVPTRLTNSGGEVRSAIVCADCCG